ncbi:MAG: hypothetical protein MJZ16_04450, partial [Bacteroidales bacterium]|nr:hypothetical protein [Bacteroidales bacterium]
LETEIYAHTLLCEMFKDEDSSLSDDIRLWLMIQKETQQWKSDPTTVLAIAAIMDGSSSLLETSVITLTATGMQQFKEIKAAANGFRVSTAYYRKDGNKWMAVKEGETLHIGDKIRAVHSVYSDENRSFVKMVTSRPACLKPDSPVSGRYGWRLYRDVRLNSTEWWWDAFAEESTRYEEYFTVSQEGVFQSSASVIECLYSPSWRANENARPDMKTAF